MSCQKIIIENEIKSCCFDGTLSEPELQPDTMYGTTTPANIELYISKYSDDSQVFLRLGAELYTIDEIEKILEKVKMVEALKVLK